MCGRFVITSPPDAIRKAFGYLDQPNFPPRYNVAPTQPVPVISVENGARRFRLMRWGLLPSWVKDPAKFSLLINARSESVLEKPAFKLAMRRRRCLIPADGYYEWSGSDGRRSPYFIQPRAGGPIGFAALMETWSGPSGEELDTAAIITTAASPDLATLHHRVPVVIRPEDYARWLDCAGVSEDDAMNLLLAPLPGEFVWHEVSIAVNKTTNDDPQLVLPMTDEQRALEAPPPKKSRARVKVIEDSGQGSLF